MGWIPQYDNDVSEETLLPYITAVTTQTQPFNPGLSVPPTSNNETRNMEFDSNGVAGVGKVVSATDPHSATSSDIPELKVEFQIRQLLDEDMMMSNMSTSNSSETSLEIEKLQVENEEERNDYSKSEISVDLEDESVENFSDRDFSQFARSPLLKQDLISTLQALTPEKTTIKYDNKDKWSASGNSLGPKWKNCKGPNLNNLLTKYIQTDGSTGKFQMSHRARGPQGIARGPQEFHVRGPQGLANGPNPALVHGPVGFARDFLAPIPESDDMSTPDAQKSADMLLEIKSSEVLPKNKSKKKRKTKTYDENPVQSTDTAKSEETINELTPTPGTNNETSAKLTENMESEDNKAQPKAKSDELKSEVVSSAMERAKSVEMTKQASSEKVDGETMDEFIARYMEEIRLKSVQEQEERARRKPKSVEQIPVQMSPAIMEQPKRKSVEQPPVRMAPANEQPKRKSVEQTPVRMAPAVEQPKRKSVEQTPVQMTPAVVEQPKRKSVEAKKPNAAAEPVLAHATPKPVLEPQPQEFEYKFRTNWDGTLPHTQAEITVKLTIVPQTGLQIDVEAPFFDDPRLPPEIPAGPVEGLWNYEVIEIFLLGTNNKYLEILLGPRGHYLIYYLEGVLQVTDKSRTLSSYTAGIRSDGARWKATAVVPWKHLPPGLSFFNAYAMHKTHPARVYMALYPAQYGQFQYPDFHRLQFFRQLPVDIVQAAENRNAGQTLRL